MFRRNRSTARAAIAVLAVLTVVSVTAAFIAITRSRESISRELAMYAVQQLETDPELSLRLAMHAVESAQTRQAEEALRRALAESQVIATLKLPGQVSRVAYSASGQTILVASDRDVWLVANGNARRLEHPALVWSAEFSRNDTLVATGGWDGKVRIWNAASGQKVAEMQAGLPKSDSPGDSWIVQETHFSSDGTQLITRGGDPSSDDTREAKVWDTKSGNLLATLRGHTASIETAVFSPDGARVATGGWDRTVRIWGASTGAVVHTLHGHIAEIAVLRYSPDGRWLFSGSRDLTVRKWDAASGALSTVSGRPKAGEGLVGARRLVVLSQSAARALVHDDTSTTLYDLGTGKLLRTVDDFPSSCETAMFSRDDRLVACPGRDGVAFVWNVDTGRRVGTLRGHKGDLNDLAIRPDDETVVTAGSDATARVWTLNPIAFDVVLQGHTESVNTAAWSPDGQSVTTGSYDGTARVWDARTGAPVSVIAPRSPTGSPAKVAWVSFAADGQRLLVGSHDAGADLWDARSGTLVRPLERVNPVGTDESLIEIEWGPADAFLVGVVNVAKERQTPPAGTSPAAKFSAGYRLFRWDADTGRLLPPIMAASPLSRGPQDRCAFSRPSGLFCLEVGDGLPVHIWDVRSGSELAQVIPQLQGVIMGAITDDGALLAMSDQGRVEIWQARTGKKQAEIPASESQFVTGVAFDAAGRQLMTIGGQATPIARVWDASSGRLLRELRGHTHGLTSGQFSPDGLLAVTGGQDATARVWRLSDGQAIATLRGNRDMVMDARFSPDGQRVLTAGADGTARIFKMLSGSVTDLNKLAVRRQTRELTRSERERFLH